MKKTLYILITLILSMTTFSSYAQNLVPNYSFEVHDTCLFGAGAIYYAPPWVDATNTSVDYFNACNPGGGGVPNNFAGNQLAQEGDAYAGFVCYVESPSVNIREYLQVKLISSLQSSKCYKLIFYVSIADNDKYGINSLSAFFSDTAITDCYQCFLPFTPQFNYYVPTVIGNSTGWTKVEGDFIAAGGEQYMTIGNFNTDANTIYTVVNSGQPSFAYYYIDSVSVTECDSSNTVQEYNKDTDFNLFPNPSDGNMQLKCSIKQSDKGAIKIYDVTGKLVEEIAIDANNNRQNIKSNLNAGIYFYQINVNDRIIKSDKIVIIK